MKNNIVRICLNCKTQFETTDSRCKYCSEGCRKEFRKNFLKIYNKNYRANHKDYFYNYVRTEEYKAKCHDYRTEKYKNDSKFREERKATAKRVREKYRNKIVELLGSKCTNPYNLPHPDWCNDSKVLEIDHINGDGWKERKQIGSSGNSVYFKHILEKIKSGSKDYQLLCSNCNKLKQIKKREFRKSFPL